MASTEEKAGPIGVPGPDAVWLCDLSLSGSRQRGAPDVEVAIMRLSAHSELLHRFLDGDPGQAAPPVRVLIRSDRLLQLPSGGTSGGNGPDSGSLAGAYLVSRPGAERQDSLRPQVFFPTPEDARQAIFAGPGTSPRDDPRHGLPMARPGRVLRVALLGLAIMLVGVLLLA